MSTFTVQVCHQSIRAEVTPLDDGYDVGIYGGSRTHVGAVTLAEPNGTIRTLLRANHKDHIVSEHFAKTLAQRWHAPICVRCGIHFDRATQEDLAQILKACDVLLASLPEKEPAADRSTANQTAAAPHS